MFQTCDQVLKKLKNFNTFHKRYLWNYTLHWTHHFIRTCPFLVIARAWCTYGKTLFSIVHMLLKRVKNFNIFNTRMHPKTSVSTYHTRPLKPIWLLYFVCVVWGIRLVKTSVLNLLPRVKKFDLFNTFHTRYLWNLVLQCTQR